MDPADLSVDLKVRNRETGEEEPLDAHSLAAETGVSIPESVLEGIRDAFLSGTVRRADGNSAGEGPRGPSSLRISLKIRSTRPVDVSLKDTCAPERDYLRSKTFVLEGTYRRGFLPYAGRIEFRLDADEGMTPLGELVLSAPRLYFIKHP
jgi:hypothetical protein